MDASKNANGFTLIELLIGMAVSMMVIAAIFASHRAQARSNLTQQMVTEMHQNARAAIFSLERDIKSAGYDPTGTTNAAITIADDDQMAFTIDRNGDGDFITANPPPNNVDPNEMIAYALTMEGNLGKSICCAAQQTVAEHIEVLNFVYLDENGNRLGPLPLDPANLALIRSVQITLIARSGEIVPVLMMKHTDNRTYTNQQGDALLVNPNDNFRRIILTENVKCRNLGL
jgi:type IV pilus assembly protein PilW